MKGGMTGWWARTAEDAAGGRALVGRDTLPDAPLGAAAALAGPTFDIALSGRPGEVATHEGVGLRIACLGLVRMDGRPGSANAIHPALAELALRYRTRGVSALQDLRGAFALAIADVEKGELVLAADRMGITPLFFHANESAIAFGTAPASLVPAAGRAGRISKQALFDFVYFHMVPGPHSIFESVERLLPGECVLCRDGCVQRSTFWQMRFEEGERRPFEDLAREFRAVLEDSVRDAVGTGKVGAFLSGGTDSSTIAGLIGKVRGEPADTYSIGFDARGYDEMEYARIAARHFGTRHHEYYVTPDDIVSAVPQLAAIHDQPYGNASAVPTFYCAKFAREDGVERMIGGDGGDELFGGNARYAKQHLYALYQTVPRAARQLAIEPAVRLLGKGPRLPVLGKVVGYVQHARIPMPARLETYNLLQRLGFRNVFQDDFVDAVDVDEPLRLLDAAYANPTAHSLINHMLALDLKFTLADNDLPKVMHSCELAGVPVAFPMLDERVVDFSACLPPDFKLKGTRLRYFFKEALRGFLPDETIRKKKQGFGLPFGPWVVSHAGLRELAFDSLGDLRKRDLFKSGFIERLRDEYLSEHPGYYGTMVWILMMLEQWFKQHVDTAADARPRLAA